MKINLNTQPKHYHLLLRILHWLLALMIVGVLFVGFTVLQSTPNADPQKLALLKMHILGGMGIGLLMIMRLITRLTTQKPAPIDTGNHLLNIAGKVAHWVLYLLVFALVASGLATANMVGLPDIIFNGQGQLPVNFNNILPLRAHGVIATTLTLFIALHGLAAMYHHFIRKDGLIARMWFFSR